MPDHFRIRLIVALGVAAVVLPLIVFLLRGGARTRKKQFASVVASALLGLVFGAIAILLLIRYGGLEMEWRGGYVPVLTWKKTKPDFDALARDRAKQAKLPLAAAVTTHGETVWNGFRGGRRDATYDQRPILTNWPAGGLHLRWKQPCGGGYSSFAMAEGRAFTIEQRHDLEVVVAYDIATGRELWTNGWQAKFSEYHSDEGPRCTPTYDDGRVYALGATGEFRCLDAASGKLIWGTNIVTETHSALPDYGLAASPLIVDEKIILQPDAYKGKSVVCYDKRDGKVIWSALDLPMGYASPELLTIDGEQQVVVCGRPDIWGLRLADGAERWHYRWHILNNERPITQPLELGSNTLFVSAAYMTGCAAFEVCHNGDGFQTRERWRNRNLKTKFASSVLCAGYVYGLDEDILACVDANTGERKWKDGRYGYGQLLLASGHLIILCANGDLALVKASPEHWQEVARFPALKGKTWNAPAIDGESLLIRNGAEMACFDISAANPVAANGSDR